MISRLRRAVRAPVRAVRPRFAVAAAIPAPIGRHGGLARQKLRDEHRNVICVFESVPVHIREDDIAGGKQIRIAHRVDQGRHKEVHVIARYTAATIHVPGRCLSNINGDRDTDRGRQR